MANVASSPARCANLAKYLAALSKSFSTGTATRPSPKRRRLHILYLLSDTLHHATRTGNSVCANAWAPHLITLVAAAASFHRCPKHKVKLDNLISLWAENQYFTGDLLSQFRDAVSKNGNITAPVIQADATSITSLKVTKEAPYTLPSSHGDSSTPWYDLPVGTWLPHLTPNSARPMVTDRIRPIQLSAGVADGPLVDAVKNLLRSADRIYSSVDVSLIDGSANEDINELGERFVVDSATGDVVSADTYYGWSRAFCEKMRARRKQTVSRGRDSRDRSYSRSESSHSRSPSPSRKRPRRYSSESRSRSLSRSRTPPARVQNHSRGNSPDRRSPPRPYNKPPAANLAGLPPPPPPPQAGFPGQWPPPPPLPPLPPGGMPNWTPDPAVMSQMMSAWSASQGFPPSLPPPPPPQGFQGAFGHNSQQQGTYNRRGGHNNNYRGRGGYDRGRGR